MGHGLYTQSILLRGKGYTLVGLVSTDEEEEALKFCNDWDKLPLMNHVGYGGDAAVTLHVDMVNDRAELFCDAQARSEQKATAVWVWENLPDTVWVAAATKRNSEREVVLLPCTHSTMLEE
jgi:hypothetical protein